MQKGRGRFYNKAIVICQKMRNRRTEGRKDTVKRPMVGVAPLFDPARESYWMLPGYFEGLRQAGALPVMLPAVRDEEEVRQLLECFDGLLLTGGQEIAPELYGCSPIRQCGTPCPERDRLEKLLF